MSLAAELLKLITTTELWFISSRTPARMGLAQQIRVGHRFQRPLSSSNENARDESLRRDAHLAKTTKYSPEDMARPGAITASWSRSHNLTPSLSSYAYRNHPYSALITNFFGVDAGKNCI